MKQEAKTLVESGYAKYNWECLVGKWDIQKSDSGEAYKCDPYADTLEGRRQADAIEDWLHYHDEWLIWRASQSEVAVHDDAPSRHQWRLDRIKWCIKQLEDR